MASPFGYVYFEEEHNVPVMATVIATMFIPGFVLGVASCWHKNMRKTIVAPPSVVLMPTFTHFTFRSNTKWCKGSEDEGGEREEGKTTALSTEPFITFSPKFTIVMSFFPSSAISSMASEWQTSVVAVAVVVVMVE